MWFFPILKTEGTAYCIWIGNINSLIHCIELSCWCVLILFQKGLLFYKKFFYKRTTLEQLHCWSCTHVLLKNRPRSSSPNLQISRSILFITSCYM
uniref:Uncharacterized protein n=1 Tax=Setaria italica TaxID=4555 RepID=K3XNM3_SETIT